MKKYLIILTMALPPYCVAQKTKHVTDSKTFVMDSTERAKINEFQRQLDANQKLAAQRKKEFEEGQKELERIDRLVNPEKYQEKKKPESPLERLLVTTLASALVYGVIYFIRRDKQRQNVRNKDHSNTNS